MDWLTFTSKLVEFLAWPSVALSLGLAYRKSILQLIPALRRLKAGPLEAEFEREARVLAAQATDAVIAANTVATAANSTSEELAAASLIDAMKVADEDAGGAIVDAWDTLDGELFRLADQLGASVDPLTSREKVYRAVLKENLLPSQLAQTVQDLRKLRDRVAHGKVNPTHAAAQDYLLAVERALKAIFSYRRNLPNYRATQAP